MATSLRTAYSAVIVKIEEGQDLEVRVMKVVKMILKVALLPVIAVLWVVDLLANMLLTVGSYVIGPLMFFIFLFDNIESLNAITTFFQD